MSSMVIILSLDVVLSFPASVTWPTLAEWKQLMASQQHTLSSQTLVHVGETSCHFLCRVSIVNLPSGPTQVSGPLLITVF